MDMKTRDLFRKTPLSYLFVSLFTGLSSGFFYPLLGIFVVDGLHASPFEMGVFLALSILSAVFISHQIAQFSDKNGDRRKIILFSQAAFIVVMILFTVVRRYYLALFIMLSISSFTASAMPQTYTLAREFSDKNLGKNATLFVSLMRAMMSLSWVIGPPLAFILYGKYGFNGAFIFAASAMLFSSFIVWTMFPTRKVIQSDLNEHRRFTGLSWRKREGISLYLCALLMLFWANSMYVMSMPLYVTKELNLSGEIAGQLMGLAAFIEIPIMVLAGIWALKVPPQKLMILGAASACLFYLCLFYAQSLWQIYSLQLLNGLAVGITASLGIVIIQNMMSQQMGLATTLFNNCLMIASLMSRISVGIIAEYKDYHTVILGMIGGGSCAFILLFVSGKKKSILPSNEFLFGEEK